MRHAILITAVLLAAAPAVAAKPKLTPEQEFAKLTKGGVPGKPTTCITRTLSQDSTTIDGLGIAQKQGRTWYLNRLGGDCPLTRNDTLVTSTPTTQVCRGDIARVFDSAAQIPKGSCVYGDWVPYEIAK